MKKSERAWGREAFTLVELLVVIAIIGIVAAIVVGGFGTSNARQLESAGNRVVDLINAARQNAITRNHPTAFILVTGSQNSQLDNRLFVLEELVPPAPGSTVTTPTWQQASKWTLLPTGAIAYGTNDNSEQNKYFFMPAPNPAPQAFNLNFQGTAITPDNTVYEVFLPSGALMNVTVPPFLTLAPGTMVNDQATYFGKTAGGGTPDNNGNIPANYYEITVNNYTGIPKVDRP